MPSLSAGSDYVAQTTSLTFSTGDLRECVEIDLIDDGVAEPVESFALTLQTNSLPFFRSATTVLIQGGGEKERERERENIGFYCI